jgi:CHAT domain-containing protein
MSPAAGQRRYLIDVVGRLTTVPSRTVLHSVVSLYKSNLDQRVSSVLLVGDPESMDLPAVQGEFEGIRRAIGRTTSATERKDLGPAVRSSPAVHFAVHAFFNHANLGHSGLSLKDGTWTLAEITRIAAKRTRLVTMGACESGQSGLLPGDEVWGLANGFMFAGIPAVVGSLWKQDDEAARLFFSTFYTRMRNRQDVGAAFRAAMLDVRDSPELAEGITDQPGLMGSSNPCFWAGFNFIGE